MDVEEAYSEFDKKFKDNADKVNGVDLDSEATYNGDERELYLDTYKEINHIEKEV